MPGKRENSKCHHYWVINDRDGGTCRKCGEVKDFAAIRRKLDQKLSSRIAAVKEATWLEKQARDALRLEGKAVHYDW